MRTISDHKLIDVRISKQAFDYVKKNAPYVEGNIPSAHGQLNSILKDKTAICCNYHVLKMMQDLDYRSNVTHSVVVIKEVLALKLELSQLWSAMIKGGFVFAHIMAE